MDEQILKAEQLKEKKDGWVGGLILVGVGSLIFLAQNFNLPDSFGLMILPILAAIFMVSGIASRQAGLMVPGGILGGIGLGTVLIADPLGLELFHRIDDGAIFMFSFALGWASITLMTALFTGRAARWPLIPGSIMALIGATVLNENLFAPFWDVVNLGWPLVMIGVGVWTLIQTVGRE